MDRQLELFFLGALDISLKPRSKRRQPRGEKGLGSGLPLLGGRERGGEGLGLVAPPPSLPNNVGSSSMQLSWPWPSEPESAPWTQKVGAARVCLARLWNSAFLGISTSH